jgi:hypothetical protein
MDIARYNNNNNWFNWINHVTENHPEDSGDSAAAPEADQRF